MSKNELQDSTQSTFERDWTQISSLLSTLKTAYTKTVDDEAEFQFRRMKTLHALEDLLICDVVIAIKKQIPQIMWKHIFYANIERLKKNPVGENRNALKEELEFVTHYLRQIISSLCALTRTAIELDQRRDLESAVKDANYKFMIALGDVCRYRFLNKFENNLFDAKKWYKDAFLLRPDIGLAHSQLGLVSSYEKNDLLIHYYYWLSYGNIQSVSIAQENIELLYNRYNPENLSNSTTGQVSNSPLVFNYLLCLAAMYTTSREIQLLAQCEHVFSTFLDRGDYENWLPQIKYLLVPMMIETADLNRYFDASESPALKKHARCRQTLLLGMSFDLTIHASKIFIKAFDKDDEDETNDQPENRDTLLLESIEIVGVLVTFLIAQTPLIKLYQEYGVLLDARFEKRLVELLSLLSEIFNIIAEIADVEEVGSLSDLDLDLIGLQCLSSMYSIAKIRPFLKGHRRGMPHSDALQVVFSRIGSFLDSLVKLSWIPILKYESSSNRYSLKSKETKEKQMLQLMKAMAAQKLSAEVETLESNIKRKQARLNIPVFVVDLITILYHLELIKQWVISRSCIVVVPHEAIQQLDFLKKGSDPINVSARSAIRYIEARLCSKTPYVIAQPQQQSVLLDARKPALLSTSSFSTDAVNSGNLVALEYVRCCQYYLEQHISSAMWLVSEEHEVQKEAHAVGVATCRPTQVFSLMRQFKSSRLSKKKSKE